MDSIASILNISELNSVSVEVDDNMIFVKGKLEGLSSCPRCSGTHINQKSKNDRLLRLPPVCGKEAKLQVLVQKQRCMDCSHSWWPSIPFAQGKQRITKSFVNYALELLRFGTIQDVSKHLNVSWDVIKSIHKQYLQKEYEEIDMSDVECVGIDEFSIAKRHKYMSIIVEFKTRRILYAVEGRKKKDIKAALKELKKKHPTLRLLEWI